MKLRIQVLIMTVVGFLVLAASGLGQGTNRYLLRADSSEQAAICAQYGLTVLGPLGPSEAALVTGPGSVPSDQLVQEVAADPRVDGFEPEGTTTLVEASPRAQQAESGASLNSALSDISLASFYGNPVWTAYLNQPVLAQINGFQPGTPTPAGLGAVVADIDTGVDFSTPALRGVLLPGYDFTRNQPVASELADLNQSTVAILNQSTVAILNQSTVAILNQSTVTILNQSTVAILNQSLVALLNGNPLPQEFGHGTMVAGLIHLVAPGAKIMPLKAFGSDGSARQGDIIRAIYYAVDNGANVINMSFSQGPLSKEMLLAINYAYRHGVVCVASSGNDGLRTVVYPAALGYVIGVGSVSASGGLSAFSNSGPNVVTLAAPGEGLITTFPGGHYAAVSGTSFSAALVSGASAIGLGRLNLSGLNSHNYSDFAEAMQAIASVHPYNPVLGWGSLDVRRMSAFRPQ